MKDTFAFRHRLRVRYQETDQMGVVYHANYLNWFEIGRTEWIRELGTPYTRLEEAGLFLPVTDVQIQYVRPARYDDMADVYVRLTECSHLRIGFEYAVYRADTDDLLVTGSTRHVWVDASWKPVRLSKRMPELFAIIAVQLEG